jgi:hypothetical protein
MRQKYVRLKEYDSFIFFSEIVEHSRFKNFNPVSAGFCYISGKQVTCFGESFSLKLKSMGEEDTMLATKQVFGIDAMLELKKDSN